MPKYKTDYKPGDEFPLTRYNRKGVVKKIINESYEVEVYDPISEGLWYFKVDKNTGVRTYKAFLNKQQVAELRKKKHELG